MVQLIEYEVEQYQGSAQRMRIFIDATGKKQSEISRISLVAQGTISRVLNGNQVLGDDVIEKLTSKFDVNVEWLKSGIGEMGSAKVRPKVFISHNSDNGTYTETNGIGVDHTNARSLGVHDPDVYQEVKFVSYRAWATFTDNFGDFDFQDVKETYPVYLPRLNFPITDRHMVFELMGDSMEERLYSRDVILTELVDEGNFEYLNSWIYVVAYRNQLVVKRVIDNDLLINGTLTLHSDNRKHGKITVRREDIRYIWRFNAIIFSSAV